MVELREIFHIKYGNQFDLNKMEIVENGVNFISRSSKNNGLSAIVAKVDGVEPNEAGSITVTLGGTYLLSAFIQPKPFYTAQNIKVLTPKSQMSLAQKSFYCVAISKNRFRYTSHGREANSTFDNILVPALDEIPEWVSDYDVEAFDKADRPYIDGSTSNLITDGWKSFFYKDLFEIKKGKRLTKANMSKGDTPFIGAIEFR